MYSLVSRPFARVGYKFIQLEADECKKCKLYEVCMGKLKPNRPYEIIEVTDKTFKCTMHGKVVLVKVRPAPIEANIPAKMAFEGATIKLDLSFTSNCSVTCIEYSYCHPEGLKNGDKCQILSTLSKRIFCPKNQSLRRVILLWRD